MICSKKRTCTKMEKVDKMIYILTRLMTRKEKDDVFILPRAYNGFSNLRRKKLDFSLNCVDFTFFKCRLYSTTFNGTFSLTCGHEMYSISVYAVVYYTIRTSVCSYLVNWTGWWKAVKITGKDRKEGKVVASWTRFPDWNLNSTLDYFWTRRSVNAVNVNQTLYIYIIFLHCISLIKPCSIIISPSTGK